MERINYCRIISPHDLLERDMPLQPMDPKDLSDFAGQGQVSYQICKEFLEAAIVIAKVDPNDFPGRKMSAISSSINAFIRRHELPMKNTYRRGDIVLYRTDIAEDRTVEKKNIEDYVDTGFSLPIGKADPQLVARQDIPTLSVGTARTRLEEAGEGPE